MRLSADSLPRFVFILAEAELELIPDEILSESSVMAHARSRGKNPSNMLLDSSYHHAAMNELVDGESRGRPDISHFFLLLCLDSRLNRLGLLRTIIHTRNNERIGISGETRLPPSHHRFVGLIESLFQNRVVPSKENPLILIENNWTLADILKAEKCDRILMLDASDEVRNPDDVIMRKNSEFTGIIIGGFPSGTYKSDLSGIEVERISLGKDVLKVWTVTSEMLSAALKAVTKSSEFHPSD